MQPPHRGDSQVSKVRDESGFVNQSLVVRVCSVSVPRNENENKNKFDGIRTVPAVAKLSNTAMQCLSVNL